MLLIAIVLVAIGRADRMGSTTFDRGTISNQHASNSQATELAAKFEHLEAGERDRLAQLPGAFDAMLPVLERVRAEYIRDNFSGPASIDLPDAFETICKSLTPKNAPRFVELLKRWHGKDKYLNWQPLDIIPLAHEPHAELLSEWFKSIVLEAGWPLPNAHPNDGLNNIYRLGEALSAWMRSGTGELVEYGLRILNDLEAHRAYKGIVYTNLAASGDPRVIKRFLAMRPLPKAKGKGFTEEQRMAQIAFEARFHFSDTVTPPFNERTNGPAVFYFPSGMKSFPLHGPALCDWTRVEVIQRKSTPVFTLEKWSIHGRANLVAWLRRMKLSSGPRIIGRRS